MEFFDSALKALPVTATHPLAFLGYALLVLCWLIVELRVRRNRNLLTRIDKIPAKDRLEALKMEMGVVKVKGGLEPEQWLRQRIHLYYFILTGMVLIVLLAIVIVAFGRKSGDKGHITDPEASSVAVAPQGAIAQVQLHAPVPEAASARISPATHSPVNMVSVKGSENQIVQGNNNSVEKNFYYTSDGRLTQVNAKLIATEYIGGNPEKIVSYEIIETDGGAPYLLIIFRSPERGIYKVHSVKFKSGSWQTSWAGELQARPFEVGNQSIYSRRIRGRDYYVFSGCYPHRCVDAWGLFVFDPSENEGFAAVSGYDEGSDSKISFPLGFPGGIAKLHDFTILLHREILRTREPFPKNRYADEDRLRVLAELPFEAEPVPDLVDEVDVKESDVSSFPVVQIFLRSHPGLRIVQLHVANLDDDAQLEWLVYGASSTAKVVAVIDDGSVMELPVADWEFSWFSVGVYKPIRSSTIIVLGTLLGAAGNFGVVELFSHEGTSYENIQDEGLEEKMKKKFGIIGALEQ